MNLYRLKYSLFSIIMLLTGVNSFADNVIKGYVYDLNNKKPVPNVVVATENGNNNLYVISDSMGFFSLNNIPTDSVTLHFSHLSYEALSLRTNCDSVLTVYLEPKDNMLEEVVVKAEYITRKDGISTVNVAALPNVELYRTDQILKQIPGVIQMDKGSYTLNGETVTVYINGVRQNISPSSLHSFLSGLPASAVKSVKLIPVNSGQFSSKTKAVIDLKIKDNIPLGHILQPSLNTSYRDEEMDNIGADLFFMAKKGRWLYHNSLSFSNESEKGESLDSLFMKDIYNTTTNTFQSGRSNTINYQGSFSYLLPNDNNLIINAFIYNDFGKTDSRWLNNSSVSFEESKDRNDLYNLALSYNIPSDKNKFNGTVTYSLSYGGRHDNMTFRNAVDDTALNHGKKEMEGWMNNLTATFYTDIDDWIFTYGTQLDYNSVWDKSRYDNGSADMSESVFTGSEWLTALFGQVRYRVSRELSVMAGLRMETTDYKYNHQRQGNVKTSYVDFFPSLLINFDSPSYSGTLGCISQIYRANFTEMLPGLRKTNDFIYVKGNPDLKPTNAYIFLLYNTWFGFLQTNFAYYRGKNAITYKYEMTDDYMVMSKINAADYHMFYTNVVFPFTLFGNRLSGQFQFNASYKKLFDVRNGFQIPDGRKTGCWKTSYDAVINYSPTDRLAFMCSMKAVPETDATLYHSNGWVSLGADISYSLLRDKSMTVSCFVSDCFDRDRYNKNYFLSSHYLTGQYYRGPQIGISLRWRLKKGQNVDEEYRDYTPNTGRF